MPDAHPNDLARAALQRAAGRESDAERRYRLERETDAAIQAAQATPDDDAEYHSTMLRWLAQRAHRVTPAESAALNAAAAWIERQS